MQASEEKVQVLEKKVHFPEKVQVPETQRESSSRGSLQTQRETLQPKKHVWPVVNKGAPTTAKKESRKEWKMLQDKKKKQVASSSDSDTSEKGIVHHIGIFAIVSTKSWESIKSSDEDDIFPSVGSTSLIKRECLFVYLGRYSKPQGSGFGGKSTTREPCGLGTQVWSFGTHHVLGKNHDGFTTSDG